MPILYLTPPKLSAFFAQIHSPRDRAVFSVIYHYGLRVSEATLLKVEDIDFERNTIVIRRLKRGLGGIKPLLANTSQVLQTYLPVRQRIGDGLFTGRQGNLGRHQIYHLFKRYALRAGIAEHSVHCLRHSIATHLLEADFGLEFVRDHLGHRNIQSTLIYAQLTDRGLRKAFEKIEQADDIVKL